MRKKLPKKSYFCTVLPWLNSKTNKNERWKIIDSSHRSATYQRIRSMVFSCSNIDYLFFSFLLHLLWLKVFLLIIATISLCAVWQYPLIYERSQQAKARWRRVVRYIFIGTYLNWWKKQFYRLKYYNVAYTRYINEHKVKGKWGDWTFWRWIFSAMDAEIFKPTLDDYTSTNMKRYDDRYLHPPIYKR